MAAGLPKYPSAMDLDQLRTTAAYQVGDPVHHNGVVYRVVARYYRRSQQTILYDLLEVVRPGGTPRRTNAVPERYVHKPSLRTLGLGER